MRNLRSWLVMREKKDVVETEKDDDSRVQLENQGVLKNYSVILASTIIVLAGIHATRSILGPILLATFFTVLLISPIKWLCSKGLAAWLSLTSVIIAVIAVAIMVTTLVATQLAQFAGNIPDYRDRFNDILSSYDLGFSVDEFLPGFLKSKDKTREEKLEEKVDENDESSKQVRNVRSADLAGKEIIPGLISHTEPVGASTTPKIAESITLRDSNDDETVSPGEEGKEEKIFFETPVRDDSIIPENPKDSWIDDRNRDSEGLRLQNPPNVRELLTEQDNENVDVGDREADFDAEKETRQNADDDKTQSEESDSEEERKAAVVSAADAVDASSEELFRFLRGLAAELSYLGSDAFIITLMLIFMLCETARIPKKLVAVWGEKKFTNSHIEKVLEDIRRYMVIKTWMSVLVGIFVTILLIVSNVQYPLLWGFVAFLLNYIPNIGSVVAAIPPIILATIEHGLVVGGIDAIFFVLINCGVGYGLEPRLLGNGLNLSPLVVLLALVFFGWLLGPVGMFLSPPLAVIMKIIFQAFPETYWLAALMADKPPKRVFEEAQVEV